MNPFHWYSVDLDEYTAALEEAMRQGGATDEEIREAVMGAQVDEAMPDPDGPWGLERLP